MQGIPSYQRENSSAATASIEKHFTWIHLLLIFFSLPRLRSIRRLGVGTGLQMRVKEFRNKNVRVYLQPADAPWAPAPRPSHAAIKPCKLITWKIWENRALSTTGAWPLHGQCHIWNCSAFLHSAALLSTRSSLDCCDYDCLSPPS